MKITYLTNNQIDKHLVYKYLILIVIRTDCQLVVQLESLQATYKQIPSLRNLKNIFAHPLHSLAMSEIEEYFRTLESDRSETTQGDAEKILFACTFVQHVGEAKWQKGSYSLMVTGRPSQDGTPH